MRGKPSQLLVDVSVGGITPAHAGKTRPVPSTWARIWDHPRVCGENVTLFRSIFQGLGSPPRVRGKPYCFTENASAFGITPACAGKTPAPPSLGRRRRDHPRVCGENNMQGKKLDHVEGSPPRVRGKLFCMNNFYKGIGITPAHAGKTLLGRS